LTSPAWTKSDAKTQAENNKLCLLGLPSAKQVNEIEVYYVDQLLGYLDAKFKDGVQDHLDGLSTVRMILLFILLGIVALMYLVFWVPLIRDYYQLLIKSRQMLILIPIDVIATTKPIRQYLKAFITHYGVWDEDDE